MSDKELIRQEIESYKESMKGLEPHSDFRRGQLTAYNQIMQFIDSLPKEPKKQPKYKVGDIIKGPHNNIFEIKEVLEKQYVLHSKNGDEVNSITIVDRSSCVVEEPAIEDLEEEMIKWHKEHFGNKRDRNKTSGEYLTRKSQLDIAQHFAEWQRKKDQETIELAEDHAMLAGMNKMKEEMMKAAVEGEYWIGEIHLDTPIIQGYDDGDRIKFIPIKTEQQ